MNEMMSSLRWRFFFFSISQAFETEPNKNALLSVKYCSRLLEFIDEASHIKKCNKTIFNRLQKWHRQQEKGDGY